MNTVDRQYIRHPSEIPLEFCLTETPPICNVDYLQNVSLGGLSFHSSAYIEPEKWIHLYIPIDEMLFEADAQVCWCKEGKQNSYDIGVSFKDPKEAFSARMVEQVCYIEEYKKTILKKEGRELSSDQAAAEWIEKFAGHFPSNHATIDNNIDFPND